MPVRKADSRRTTAGQHRGLMMSAHYRVVLCIGLLALPIAARAQSLAPQTTWVNDHARFVIQSIDPDGKLTGTYENFGSNFSCAGQVFPVTGWVDGERISYAARRKKPGQLHLGPSLDRLRSWRRASRGVCCGLLGRHAGCRRERRGSIPQGILVPRFAELLGGHH